MTLDRMFPNITTHRFSLSRFQWTSKYEDFLLCHSLQEGSIYRCRGASPVSAWLKSLFYSYITGAKWLTSQLFPNGILHMNELWKILISMTASLHSSKGITLPSNTLPQIRGMFVNGKRGNSLLVGLVEITHYKCSRSKLLKENQMLSMR